MNPQLRDTVPSSSQYIKNGKSLLKAIWQSSTNFNNSITNLTRLIEQCD